jgi:molybdopterin-synthase adenylyltransferase
VRIWGEECQRRIDDATAGIVGLGGTGSMVLQALARMGVKKFVLCDPDAIEPSNLSRLPYAYEGDVGKPKARVAAGYVRKIARGANVETVSGGVQDATAAFRGCDVLFGCADNDGARLSMNQIALKYFIPYIDTGVEIFVEGDRVRDMGGQVRVVVPGVTGCLECAGAIDHEDATASLLSADDLAVRGAAGYVNGTGLTPAPAVITLNAVIASLAAQEFVDMVARRDRVSPWNYFLYDATGPAVERLAFERSPECPMCGPDGILGMGDLRKPARPRIRTIAAP